MKIAVIIFILFVQFMIIGSFGGLHSYYLSSKQVLTEQTNEYLEAIAQSRANHIEDFLEEHKHMVELLAFSTEYSELNEIIKIHPEFYEVFILNKNGRLAGTTNPEEEIGTDFSKDLLFLNAKEKVYIKDAFYDEEFGKNSIAISAPIFDEAEKLSGVFIVRMETEELDKITLDRTGLGQTGEIYLINEHRYMITSSKFFPAEMTFLKLEVDTEGSNHCFEHGEEGHITFIYPDYRGVEVLGAHATIKEMKWCLLAEIDETEALSELRDKLIISAFVISIIILIIIVFFIFLSGSFIKRLVEQAHSKKQEGKK